MYKIEKDVPLVEWKRGPKYTYPFGDMQVGDSFFVRAEPRFRGLHNSALNFVRKHEPDKKFSVRRVEGGFRCWRVK